jgi:hypothetical protein
MDTNLLASGTRRFRTAFSYAPMFILALSCLVAACSSSDDAAKGEGKAADRAPVIEKIEGMKYYVGGPILKYDPYGRLRLGGFNGEVSTPSTRGLLIGFKKNEDDTFDFRSWLNGKPFARSTGKVDEQGLLWYEERLSLDGNGNVTMRQKFEYDDEAKIIRTTLEQIDVEDGEVIKSTTQEMPYAVEREEWTEEDDREMGLLNDEKDDESGESTD